MTLNTPVMAIDCNLVDETRKPYCIALKTVLDHQSCRELYTDSLEQSLCYSLETLHNSGKCANSKLENLYQLGTETRGLPRLDDSQAGISPLLSPKELLIQRNCKLIAFGLDAKNCSPFQNIRDQNLCEFGRYIRWDHQIYYVRAREALLDGKIQPHIDAWFNLHFDRTHPHLYTEELYRKTRLLSKRLIRRLHEQAHLNPRIYADYFATLVTSLEPIKDGLLKQDRIPFVPIGTVFKNLFSPNALIPNSILIQKDTNRILVLLESIMAETHRYPIQPFQKGTTRNLYLAFDYEKATSDKFNGDPFLAVAISALRPGEGGSSFKLLDQEWLLQAKLRDQEGIAQVDSFVVIPQDLAYSVSSNTNDYRFAHFLNFQKLYDTDLFELTREIVTKYQEQGNKIESVHGRSFERFKIDMMVNLLKPLNVLRERKIYHRDIKPENIFIEIPPSGETLPHIGDLGSAQSIDADEMQKTRTGGTLSHYSPEHVRQLQGKRRLRNQNPLEKLNHDFWSTGISLYCVVPPRDDTVDLWTNGNKDQEQELLKILASLNRKSDLSKIGINDLNLKDPYDSVLSMMLNPTLRSTDNVVAKALAKAEKAQAKLAKVPEPGFYFHPLLESE